MLIQSISGINNNKIQSNNVKNNEISQKTVNNMTLPSFADAKSLVNMSFKAAIHNYAEHGDLEGLKRELAKGESVNAKDWNGFTPLMVAGHSHRINTFNELLKHPDIDINAQPNKMDTALIRVSRNGYSEMVKKLVERPEIDVNIQRKDDGETALIAACFAAKEQAVKELLKHPDIDVNLQNKDGLTALIYACRYGSPKMVEALLKMPDIDVNLKDKSGDTALIWAVTNKRPEIVKQLINHPDIDVNVRDKDGNTALNRASYSNRINEVKELLKHPDIDISIEDCFGGTALYYAEDKKHSEIAKMIKDYVPGVDRRNGVIKAEKTKQIDVEKLTSFKEIWSDEEKQSIAKMVEDKDYDGLAKVFESKGTELNGRYEQLINDIDSVKEAAEKSARETETEKIREEERSAAQKDVADKIAELDKSKAEYAEKNKALDNLINDYQTMVAEDVEDAKSGFRTLYDIKSEELPEKMDLGEQMIYVIDIMSNNRNKLTNMNSDSPEKITKTLQDNNGQISADGLKFLERVIRVSDRSCTENDLISSINSVKNKNGYIDMKKVSYFIANLSWGQSRISEVIQKVEQYDSKNNQE